MKSKALKFNLKNKKIEIGALFLIQAFIIAMTLFYALLTRLGLVNEQHHCVIMRAALVLLFILNWSIGVAFICLFTEIEDLVEKEKEYEIQKIQIKQMQESNDLLKSQKHEFSNNLQVLWGMLSLGDIEKAKEYLGKYSNTFNIDENKLTKLNKLSCTHLYTLLLNKAYKCKNIGVKIHYYIQPYIPLEDFNPIDIVCILGNLLDNAIYEVEKLETGDGWVIVDMYCDDEKCSFHVTNKGTVIPEKMRNKIFKKGFTTKNEDGSGFGLYNVKKVVKKYNGKIYVKSDSYIGTSFIVRMPRTSVSKINKLSKSEHEIKFSL